MCYLCGTVGHVSMRCPDSRCQYCFQRNHRGRVSDGHVLGSSVSWSTVLYMLLSTMSSLLVFMKVWLYCSSSYSIALTVCAAFICALPSLSPLPLSPPSLSLLSLPLSPLPLYQQCNPSYSFGTCGRCYVKGHVDSVSYIPSYSIRIVDWRIIPL